MKRILLAMLIVLGISFYANAQVNTWDNSDLNNNWNDADNWSQNSVPDAADDVVININATINMATSPTINSLTIGGSAVVSLTATGGDRTITIDNDGSNIASNASLTLIGSTNNFMAIVFAAAGAPHTMEIDGTLVLSATGDDGTYNATNSTTNVDGIFRKQSTTNVTSTATNLLFSATGSYEHELDGGTIPTATWNDASTVLIEGVTANTPAGLNQSFGNFTWNCPGQSAEISTGTNLTTIDGNFTVANTNSQILRASGASAVTLTIGGDFIINSATSIYAMVDGGGTKTINVGDDFSLTAGSFQMSTAGGTVAAQLNVAGDFTHSGGTLTELGTSTASINFNGTSTQIFTSGGTVSNSIAFTVNNLAILEVAADVTVIGGSAFTLVNGGTLRIKSTAGITSAGATGNVQSTSRTFNTGGIYEYVGSAAQVTGSGMPATVRGLRVDNSAGLTISNPVTLTPSVATTNPLVLANGDITGALITVGSAYTGAGGGGSTSSHVNAAMAKTGSTAYEFPIGNGTLYRPIEISSLSGSATVTAQYFQANPKTTFNDVMGSGVNHISACEYWDLNDGAATITGNVQLTFGGTSCNGGAYVNDPASLLVAHFSSGAWQNQGNDGAATTTTVQGNIPSTFSPFTVGSSTAMNPLPVKFGGIKAFENGTGVQIDWATHSESGLSHYVIERSSNGSSFTSIGTVLANNLVSESKYSFMDPSPLVVGFYRISSVNYDGKRASSSIVKVSLDKSNVTVSLYPNPVTNGNISFQTSNLVKGVYTIRIFSATGQQVINQRMSHSGGAINQTIQLPSAAGKGLYTLQVENETIKVISRPFLVQ